MTKQILCSSQELKDYAEGLVAGELCYEPLFLPGPIFLEGQGEKVCKDADVWRLQTASLLAKFFWSSLVAPTAADREARAQPSGTPLDNWAKANSRGSRSPQSAAVMHRQPRPARQCDCSASETASIPDRNQPGQRTVFLVAGKAGRAKQLGSKQHLLVALDGGH